MYVSEYAASRRRSRFLGGVPAINQGGGAYNKPSSPSITQNPLVYSNPYSGAIAGGVEVAKKLGLKIDLKTPAAHVADRMAHAALLKTAALAGDNTAWAQLWEASGRDLPVRAVAGSTVTGSKGWPRVKPQLTSILQEIEAARGVPAPGNTTQGQSSGAFPQMMSAVGGVPVIATLGFLALSFLLKNR
jgi:hypothetical protein